MRRRVIGWDRLPLVAVSLAGTALLLQAWPDSLAALGYAHGAMVKMEMWRLLTCHLVHWSWSHALWDALTLAAIGGACELLDRRAFLISLAGSAMLIPLAFELLLPHLDWYAGLSGLDVAVYATFFVILCRQLWRSAGLLVQALLIAALVGLFAKLGYEVLVGDTLFVDPAGAGFVPVPLAHLVGALVGVAVGARPGAPCETAIAQQNRAQRRPIKKTQLRPRHTDQAENPAVVAPTTAPGLR